MGKVDIKRQYALLAYSNWPIGSMSIVVEYVHDENCLYRVVSLRPVTHPGEKVE